MYFKTSIGGVLLASLAIAGPVHASDTGLYVGGSVGQTTIKENDIDFDESDTSYKAFAGYMILPFLGVEGGYVNFGGPNKNYNGLGSVDIDVDGWEAFVLGALPLGPFDVFAKAGVLSYDIDAKVQGPGLGSLSGSDSDEVGAYGAGVAFGIDRFQIRGEYTYYDVSDVDDVYMLSAGVTYRF
jgi:OOP family OmpA-OmpF porin